MSKRHQSSRRRSYGKRQHEIRERVDRRSTPEQSDLGHEPEDQPADSFQGFDLGLGGRRLTFAVGD